MRRFVDFFDMNNSKRCTTDLTWKKQNADEKSYFYKLIDDDNWHQMKRMAKMKDRYEKKAILALGEGLMHQDQTYSCFMKETIKAVRSVKTLVKYLRETYEGLKCPEHASFENMK